MVRKSSITTIVAIIGVFVSNIFFLQALAYSVNNSTTTQSYDTNGGMNELLTPFNNFINSVNSIGTSSLKIMPPGPFVAPVTPQMAPANGLLRTTAQDGLQAFDTWFYSLTGIHVTNIFLEILGVFSWFLGSLKGTVDWLLGLFH